jgi:hypothetical protein
MMAKRAVFFLACDGTLVGEYRGLAAAKRAGGSGYGAAHSWKKASFRLQADGPTITEYYGGAGNRCTISDHIATLRLKGRG